MILQKQDQSPGGQADEEAHLIRQAQIDPAAFAELYQQHLGRIYAYLRVRIGNDDDAADLAQQVFLQAFDALPRYRQRGVPFSAWLFQIAHNVVTNTYRRKKNEVSWDFSLLHSQPSSELDLEANVLYKERLHQLHVLLNQMNPEKRELLALRFAAGLSIPQIAVIVGRSPAAVKKEVARTLRKLKELYHD